MSPLGSHASGLTVTIRREGEVQVVSLHGAAGAEHADDLHRRLVTTAEETPAKIILDLSELTFVNSAGLGAFIAVHRRCHERGGEACFVRPREAVAQVLRVTNLDRLMRTYPDVESARQALTGAAG